MSIVPKSLDKYFRTREGLIKKNLQYYITLNEHLREQMQIGKKEDIAQIRLTNQTTPHYFKITEDNCELAFADDCWKFLRDNEKARTLYLYIKKHIKENYPSFEIPLLHFIPHDNQQNVWCDAQYCDRSETGQDYIYVNPNTLNKSRGIYLVNIIAHELQHSYDFNEIVLRTIPNLTHRYVKDPNKNYEEIMNLPIEGTIRNLRTGKDEPITPKLRDMILKAKSYISPIPSISSYNSTTQIHSDREMLYYLQHLSYRFSPTEQRAFRKGAETAEQIFKANKEKGAHSPYDEDQLKSLKERINIAKRKMLMTEQLTGKQMYEIHNLFSRYLYFSPMAQTNNEYQPLVNQLKTELTKVSKTAFANMSKDSPSM